MANTDTQNISVREIVQNLKLLDEAGRILKDPHRIDIRCPFYIRVLEHEDPTIIDFDRGYKRVRLTERFYDKLDNVLSFLNPDWIMPLSGFYPLRSPSGEWDLCPVQLDTATLLWLCGFGNPAEQEKLKAVGELRLFAQPSSLDSGGAKHVYNARAEKGMALIESGIFSDWEEVECYAQIQEILGERQAYSTDFSDD